MTTIIRIRDRPKMLCYQQQCVAVSILPLQSRDASERFVHIFHKPLSSLKYTQLHHNHHERDSAIGNKNVATGNRGIWVSFSTWWHLFKKKLFTKIVKSKVTSTSPCGWWYEIETNKSFIGAKSLKIISKIDSRSCAKNNGARLFTLQSYWLSWHFWLWTYEVITISIVLPTVWGKVLNILTCTSNKLSLQLKQSTNIPFLSKLSLKTQLARVC